MPRGSGSPAFRERALAAAILCVAGAALAQDPAGSAPAPDGERAPREVRVRIVADEEFRAHPNWKGEAALRLTYASNVFDREFKIRWKIAAFEEWTSDDDAGSLAALVNAVAKVPAADAEIVVGFSGQSRAAGARHDYVHDGYGRFYGPAAIVRSDGAVTPDGNDTYVLCHELAHVFGAWHQRDVRSVMFPIESPWSRKFDDVTRSAIETARDLDFTRGVEWLGPEREARLVELFRRSSVPPEHQLPAAMVWAERAASIPAERADECAVAWQRAVSLHEAAEGPERNSTLACRLAAARRLSSLGRPEAARTHADAAFAEAEAHPEAEEVVGEAAELVAELAERVGDTALARALREQVLEARRTKLGADAEATRRIAGLLRPAAGPAARSVPRVTVKTETASGATRVVTQVDAVAADPGVRADDSPVDAGTSPAGPLRFRVVPDAKLPPEWRREDDFFSDVFEVTASAAGTLHCTFAEEPGAAPPPSGWSVTHRSSRSVTHDVECRPGGKKGTARICVVLRRAKDEASSEGKDWEAVFVVSRLDRAHWDASDPLPVGGSKEGAVVRWRPEAPDLPSARIVGDSATLVAWRWFPSGGGSTTVTTDPSNGRVLVDGREVGPSDGESGWRVSVTFEPAKEK